MSDFDWLSNSHNQRVLHTLSRRAVQQAAPEELPLFEELFPEYVQLARQKIAVTKAEDSAFRFSGEGELLTLVILPALAATLSALLVKKGTKRLSELQDAEQEFLSSSAASEHVREELQDNIVQDTPSEMPRQRLIDLLSTVLLEFLRNH